MNNVLFKLLDHGILVYLDNILMYSCTIDKYLKLLWEAFALLQIHKLNIKKSMRHLFIEIVDFLGYVFNIERVYIDQGKVDMVTK